MKKALPVTIVLFFATTVLNAQITKGNILLGGTVSYTQRTEKYSSDLFKPAKQHYITISPSVGSVVKENLVVGVEASFNSGYQRYEIPGTINENNSKSYGGALFLRRYVPLLKHFYFFGQSAAGFSKQESSQIHNGNAYAETKGWGAALNLTPGLTYGAIKKLFVELGLNNLALLGYSH